MDLNLDILDLPELSLIAVIDLELITKHYQKPLFVHLTHENPEDQHTAFQPILVNIRFLKGFKKLYFFLFVLLFQQFGLIH